jgi:hypothetical protein
VDEQEYLELIGEQPSNAVDEDEGDGEGSGGGDAKLEAVQLFFTAEAKAEFEQLVERLSPMLGATSPSACVLAAMRKA